MLLFPGVSTPLPAFPFLLVLLLAPCVLPPFPFSSIPPFHLLLVPPVLPLFPFPLLLAPPLL